MADEKSDRPKTKPGEAPAPERLADNGAKSLQEARREVAENSVEAARRSREDRKG